MRLRKQFQHVVVDGMRNGLITTSTSASRIVPIYLATSNELFDGASLAAVMVIIAGALAWWGRRRKKAPKSSPDPG